MKPSRVIPNQRRFAIMARDKFRCVYCGASAHGGIELEIDHVIPVAQGGTDDDSNLVTACWQCNNGKRAQTIEEAAESAGCAPGASCVTPLRIATKAAQYGLTYRTARRYLEEAGHVVPPPRPYHALIQATPESQAYEADVIEHALWGGT